MNLVLSYCLYLHGAGGNSTSYFYLYSTLKMSLLSANTFHVGSAFQFFSSQLDTMSPRSFPFAIILSIVIWSIIVNYPICIISSKKRSVPQFFTWCLSNSIRKIPSLVWPIPINVSLRTVDGNPIWFIFMQFAFSFVQTHLGFVL